MDTSSSMKTIIGVTSILLLGLSSAACKFSVEDEGELPEVRVEDGRLPEVDVDAPNEIELKTEKKTIEVPDIDLEYDDE